jgi:hypothetical protein
VFFPAARFFRFFSEDFGPDLKTFRAAFNEDAPTSEPALRAGEPKKQLADDSRRKAPKEKLMTTRKTNRITIQTLPREQLQSEGRNTMKQQTSSATIAQYRRPANPNVSPERWAGLIKSAHSAVMIGLFLIIASTVQAQSHLVRLGDAEANGESLVASASLSDERVVTAAKDNAGNLKLTVWDVTADGSFTQRGEKEAGVTSEFAIAGLPQGNLITAVRQQNGNLRLIAWAVDAGGQITRRGDIDGGAVQRVSIAKLGPTRVVTATQSASGETKLIVWDLGSAGSLTRRGDHVADAGTQIDVTVLSATKFVCAVKTQTGQIAISAWSVNTSGATIGALGSAQGPAVTEFAITNAALDRAVTASRLGDGSLRVDAWDVGSGTLTNASSASAGPADKIALASLGSTKVVTAVRQADHTLKLISWQVVDKIRRLDDVDAGAVTGVSVVSLGWDRLVTAVQVSGKNAKLIDWADFSVGLLSTTWGPTTSFKLPPKNNPGSGPAGQVRKAGLEVDDDEPVGVRSQGVKPKINVANLGSELAETILNPVASKPGPPPPPPNVQSPAPAFTFQPNISGVDPMIAVGLSYVVVSEQGQIQFLYKDGDKKGQQLSSKTGESTAMNSAQFFGGFLAVTNSDGSVNRNNINLYVRFPPDTTAGMSCDPSVSSGDPCENDFYDTRVSYDRFHGRFIILSALRGGVYLGGKVDPVVRRYFAIAVSRTEDPRDGFIQYLTTESNYSDWPRVAASDGVIVVAHWANKNTDATPDNPTLPGNTSPLRPMAYVFRTDDMTSANLTPRNWKIYPYQTDGGSLLPISYDTKSEWTYLFKPLGDGFQVYGFKQPTDTSGWSNLPKLHSSHVDVEGGQAGFGEGIHFRSGALYLAGGVKVADRVPNKTPERWHVRGLRIPISTTANSFVAGPCPGGGCKDFDFGLHAVDDAAGDVFSYEMASLAVNRNNDMIMVYGRVPIKSTKGQEARFSIIYSDSRGLQRSRLLQAGATILKDTRCVNQNGTAMNESAKVAENFFHIQYQSTDANGNVVCPQQKDFQDYANAVVDPFDDTAFWVVHAFATAGGFKMIGAKVVP